MSIDEKLQTPRDRWNWEMYRETCNRLPMPEDKGNHPTDFETLSPSEQYALIYWIERAIVRSKRYDDRSSYGIKHDFEKEAFYISNGQFKGAMLLLGHNPKNIKDLNWQFQIKHAVVIKIQRMEYTALDESRYSLGMFDKEFARILLEAGYIELPEVNG